MASADFTLPLACGVGVQPDTGAPRIPKHPAPIFSLTSRVRQPWRLKMNPLFLALALSLHAAAFVGLQVLTDGRDSWEPPEFIPPFVVQGAFGAPDAAAPALLDESTVLSSPDIPRVDLAPTVLADIDLDSEPREIDDSEFLPAPRPLEPETIHDPAPGLETLDSLRKLAAHTFPIPGTAGEESGTNPRPADAALAALAPEPLPPAPPAPRPAPQAIGGRMGSAGGNATPEGSGRFEGASSLSGYQVKPPYPAEAQRLGLEGVCVIEMEIDATGKVVGVRLVEGTGHDCLDAAAISAARMWRFRPAHRNGIPEPATIRKRFQFKLNR